jgi:YidC/Oxa1 family membrane protein insertase
MEKNVVLAIALTVGLYVAYLVWFAPHAPPPAPRNPVATGTVAQSAAPASPEPGPATRKASAQYAPSPDLTISNSTVPGTDEPRNGVDVTLSSKGGALKAADAWACVYHPKHPHDVPGDPGRTTSWVDGMPGAFAVDLLTATDDVPDLVKSEWKISKDGDALTAEISAAGLVLTKTVRLSDDPAHPFGGTFVVTVRNESAAPGATRTLEVVGPVPSTGSQNETDHGALIAQTAEDVEVELVHGADAKKALAENPKFERRPTSGKWAWIGARADFYLGALIPAADLPAGTSVGFRVGTREDAKRPQDRDVAAATFRIPFDVPGKGGETKFAFTFYAGPNQRTLLGEETSPYHVLHNATVQRTFIFSLTPIARLLSWLLRVIESTGMGYGLAVICLTILVRGALFPLSRKSQLSMRLHAQKMQRLKPKLDAIKEKYKDAKKQQEATMKVMREEKVSLLPGGCLLAFLQMPIWIALYNVLQTTFEMRHARFLWVQDLTASDHLLAMPFTDGWPILNGWFNLLPLLMMATWYFSAAMQPLPADPQQAQQAKMMRWMPMLMGVFLYNTAAGLTLYMTMSAIWSIGESWLIRKLWLSKMEAALK